jgi:ribosomal-protein-serine acetyltransferase
MGSHVSTTLERRGAERLPIGKTCEVLRLELSDACWLQMLDESDAQELHSLIDANRSHLSRWMPWATGQDLADTLGFIRLTRRQLVDNNGFQAAIVSEGQIIGVVGFHAVDWAHRTTSIGYWLGENRQGRGTMTRAVRALVDHALKTWQLNRVEIRVATGNARSRAIPERLGFREEGTLRQVERIGDCYLDSVVYAMLACDWNAP